MKSTIIIKSLCLLILVASFNSYAEENKASFDCKKALSKIEITICADSSLAKLDIEMSEVFSKVQQRSPDTGWLLNSQRLWLKKTRSCKSNDCISSAYLQRIKELSSLASLNEVDWQNLLKTRESLKNETCKLIANLANTGQLSQYLLYEAKNIKFENRRIDLTFTTEGTAHVPAIYGYDSKTKQPLEETEMPTIPGPEDTWSGDNFGLFVYQGHTHILYFKDFKHPLASTSLNNDESSCGFSIEFEENIGAKSTQPELCQLIKAGNSPTPYTFKDKAWMAYEDVSKRYSETEITNTRMLDFANDGKPLRVAQLQLDSGAGAGCGESFFDLLDKNGTRFEVGDKRDLLMKLQNADLVNSRYPVSCGNQPNFFEYKNNVYFEDKPSVWPPENSWNEYHRVATVDKNEVVDVCDFQFKTRVISNGE